MEITDWINIVMALPLLLRVKGSCPRIQNFRINNFGIPIKKQYFLRVLEIICHSRMPKKIYVFQVDFVNI